jgi:hypothetical protein
MFGTNEIIGTTMPDYNPMSFEQGIRLILS